MEVDYTIFLKYNVDLLKYSLFREKVVINESTYLDPVHLLYKLEEILPENTVIIADGGDFVATSSYILRYNKTNYFISCILVNKLQFKIKLILLLSCVIPRNLYILYLQFLHL